MKFNPFDEFLPSKTWLLVCVWKHPLNKDVSHTIIVFQCLFQKMVGWVALEVSFHFVLKFKPFKMSQPIFLFLAIAILALRVKVIPYRKVMRSLLIYIHNGGIWEATVQPRLKKWDSFLSLRKSSKRVQCSNEFMILSTSGNGRWWDYVMAWVFAATPPLRKNGPLAAQSNSPFSDSCYTLGAIIRPQLFPSTGNILSGW